MADEIPSRTPRWIKITLVISLAVNLLIAGMVGGFILRGGPGAPGPLVSGLPIDGLRTIQRALPEDRRRAFRRDLVSKRGELGAARREMRALRVAFLAALTADPFSVEDLRAVMARQGALFEGAGDTIRQSVLTQIAAMTSEERAAFAKALEAQAKKQPRGELR